MYDVDEHGIENEPNKKTEESVTEQPIINVFHWTRHLEWNK